MLKYDAHIQAMNEEMLLLGSMETQDRDVEAYVDALEMLLSSKQRSLQSLRHEIGRFQLYRNIEITTGDTSNVTTFTSY